MEFILTAFKNASSGAIVIRIEERPHLNFKEESFMGSKVIAIVGALCMLSACTKKDNRDVSSERAADSTSNAVDTTASTTSDMANHASDTSNTVSNSTTSAQDTTMDTEKSVTKKS